MKLRKLMIFSFLLLMLSLGAVCAEDNQTDVTGNSTHVVSGDTFADVQKAVNAAGDNDVIKLNGTYTNTKKAITLSKGITIEGDPSATLDAKSISSVLIIKTKNNITLKNLIITNAISGAVTSETENTESNNLIIINCTFKNNKNYDESDGGAIFKTSDGETTIINSTFTKNKAWYGGALYIVSNEPINIYNSVFKSNYAKDSAGAIDSGLGNLNIYNSTFEKNSAKESVGAIANSWGGESNLCIYNSRFLNNTSPSVGAITFGGNASIYNCEFADNSASNNVGDIDASNYYDEYDGKQNYFLEIQNSKFINSNAQNKSKVIFSTFTDILLNNTSIESGSSNIPDVLIYVGNLTSINSTNDSIKCFEKIPGKIVTKSLKVTFDSYDHCGIRVVDDAGFLYDCKVSAKAYIKNSYKKLTTGSYDEVPVLIINDKLNVGKYTVLLTAYKKYFDIPSKNITLTIKKAKTTVKAPKVSAQYKKSKNFKITIKNKASGYAVKNVKVKVKIYTGKKYKSYTLKTNKKGVIKINTKKLKIGNHKVKITSKNTNYSISKISYIKIFSNKLIYNGG